ncbi:hypothetical protein BGX33_003623 [Mortierella sp. NVP41]|nr:hypothetical protein BGX33_003623 [Mortierella sp. NVP41]
MSIDSNDGGLSDKSSDYEASDDETPMMKLVSRFDALHAWISSSTTALQDVATVISLQQEMPFHQRVMTQSFMQHPPLARGGRHAASMRSRAIQLLQQQQQLQQEDQGNARYGVLGSVFRYLIRQPQGPPLVATNPSSEPERLLSRRDFVNDWTVKTIMDHCPGLCRLTLSECHGITDRSLELIRDSACVANRTLVSLHLAGCSQITDRGLLGLVGTSTKRTTTTDLSHEPSTSLSSSISPFSLAPIPTQTSTAQSTPTTFVRLESLDFAGCHQISDKGMIPLLKQCGSRLLQLRVSDCEEITSASVVALANHCPNTQWLDLCRTGILTEESLILLAERCTDLEWLNLARINPGQLESLDGLEANNNGDGDDVGDGGESNVNNNDGETEESEQEEEVEMDDEKILLDSNGIHHSKTDEEDEQVKEDSITDRALALLCESCPKLQLLDLSYISTISNNAMESLSETAKSLVCLTIIGCPGITSQSLLYLARLRNSSGKLGCITMGDALGISERDIEQIMQGTLSGWQKSLVDETNLGEILGRSWDE